MMPLPSPRIGPNESGWSPLGGRSARTAGRRFKMLAPRRGPNREMGYRRAARRNSVSIAWRQRAAAPTRSLRRSLYQDRDKFFRGHVRNLELTLPKAHAINFSLARAADSRPFCWQIQSISSPENPLFAYLRDHGTIVPLTLDHEMNSSPA